MVPNLFDLLFDLTRSSKYFSHSFQDLPETSTWKYKGTHTYQVQRKMRPWMTRIGVLPIQPSVSICTSIYYKLMEKKEKGKKKSSKC